MSTKVDGLVEVRAVSPEYAHEYDDLPEPRCWVYEVWDTRGRLAYVGIADNFERRWAQHVRASWWLGEIEIWYIHLCGYRTRSEAEQIEACTIDDQCPVYNTRTESGAFRRYLRSMAAEQLDDYLVPVKKRRFTRPQLSAVA